MNNEKNQNILLRNASLMHARKQLSNFSIKLTQLTKTLHI
jgi:hypothetical protein